ncbi:MAG: glycosyltransferase involved in cell wall biosynthesis [Verrucomicrobiales bacterium]|jgi:glycosyltransferase involved in cell wall biosynthesis
MRILHLVPGTGNFYSGVCLRDHALVRELRRQGHDAELIPLYLPLILDRQEKGLERIQLGGVGLYLQQHSACFRWLPRPVQQLLDAKPILRLASACMSMTRARDLGVMTVGSFQGLEGPQHKAWRRLIGFLKRDPKPDVISISLGLLAGLAKPIKEEIGCRVVVSLQGEDVFLDHLPEPWRSEAWEQLAETSAFVDRFIAPSEFYAGTMRKRLGLSEEKLVVARNGPGGDEFRPNEASKSENPPAIGFLARQSHGKGLDLLVDAFIELKRDAKTAPDLRLKIGGSMTSSDRRFVRAQQRKLDQSGLSKFVDFQPNLTFEGKLKFLQSLSALSVPTRYPEAFGLYAAEAMACGVPIVQPNHGAFPELIQAAGAGRLCQPDDSNSLAQALHQQLLADEGGSKLATRATEALTMRTVADSVLT